jgi:hypothetical protein
MLGYYFDYPTALYSKSFLILHSSIRGKKRNAYRVLVGKPEGIRSLGRPRCRWVKNIKMDLREIG